MTRPIDDSLKQTVRKLRKQGRTLEHIAKKLELSLSTVWKYAQEVDARGSASGATSADPVARAQADAQEKQRQKDYVQAIREHSFRAYLEKLVRDHARPMPPAHVPESVSSRGDPILRFPFLHLTDWHFEELVRPDGVLGLNSYDIPTACRRVHRIVHTTMHWKRDYEYAGRFRVPELVVGLCGDFLTGTLHGLERHSDAPNIVRASLACGDLLALALRDLAAVFPRVLVVGVVGNHGRLPDDRKVPTKDPTRSWDYLAYQIARRRLESQSNIEWYLPEAYGVLFEIAGHLSYMAHGNYIPNNLGVVGYGVRRFTSALASNLQAAGKKLRYCFFGHWYSSNSSEFAGIEAFIGPSLIGTQEYSFLSSGAVNSPAQELHIVDPSLGHLTRERLYGDGPGTGTGTYEVAV